MLRLVPSNTAPASERPGNADTHHSKLTFPLTGNCRRVSSYQWMYGTASISTASRYRTLLFGRASRTQRVHARSHNLIRNGPIEGNKLNRLVASNLHLNWELPRLLGSLAASRPVPSGTKDCENAPSSSDRVTEPERRGLLNEHEEVDELYHLEHLHHKQIRHDRQAHIGDPSNEPAIKEQEEDRVDFQGLNSLRHLQASHDRQSQRLAGINSKPDNGGEAPEPLHLRWSAIVRRKKRDLSHQGPLRMESRPGLSSRPFAGDYSNCSEREFAEPTLAFRADNPLSDRWITKYFMQHVFVHVSSNHHLPESVLRALLETQYFRQASSTLQSLPDVLTWSWILSATPAHAVKRLIALEDHQRTVGSPSVPLWVVLQLLRAASFHPTSLTLLIGYINRQQSNWNWGGDGIMVLVVRLLRHARLAAPACFELTTDLYLDMLAADATSPAPTASAKLTHWCNRILSLLALPAVTPFRSMRSQQASQLALLHYMQEHSPQIAITREGFRAVAKLQLMHNKTPEERQWAQAKVLTWPPWENKHQMGSFTKPSEYLGMKSRAMKVLQRMQENGYAPHDFETALSVLAGWDTDRSPTIQVRRTAWSISIAKPWVPGTRRTEGNLSPLVWTARIESTRTVREAWMCFCAYASASSATTPSPDVYHAMFRKLYASSIHLAPKHDPLPGDGLEVYPDPELQRDQVYIPEPIPSPSKLFERMISTGIKPHIGMLTTLLQYEVSIDQRKEYLQHAHIAEAKREVLALPNSFTSSDIAVALADLPQSFQKAYLSFILNSSSVRAGAKTDSSQGNMPIAKAAQDGVVLAYQVLEQLPNADMSLWNEYFRLLASAADFWSGSGARNEKRNLLSLWGFLSSTITQDLKGASLDFAALQHTAEIGFQIHTWARTEKLQSGFKKPVSIAKSIFRSAVLGHDMERCLKKSMWSSVCRHRTTVLHSVPSGDTIESLVWLFSAGQFRDGTDGIPYSADEVIRLLRWTHLHADQMLARQQRLSIRNMAAFRAFLEYRWVDDAVREVAGDDEFVVDQDEVQEAEKLCSELRGWPDEAYMQRYMFGMRGKFNRLRRKIIGVKKKQAEAGEVKDQGQAQHGVTQ